ncbi:putative nuclear protein snf4 [Phaeomoniella chlamydospora]|uniref:Putative nuclear protein snf4 n=1 Tax=Phaeomoniella chlamydospora TaxID=158046 RepID=A0A0G2E8U4_PHACM|nr:putative nuclear protein snf4 [Phaeomoniella chlamydospora]
MPVPPAPGHEAMYVQPASYLRPHARPRASSRTITPAQPERPIDRDEREGLNTIREFLKLRTTYDILPLSVRLIVFDTGLTVKESLNILIQNGIVSAPLWDSATSVFAGLLTVTDYINVIQYYWQNPEAYADINKFKLSNLRDIERALNVPPPETVSIDPERPLYDACRKMLKSRARRIPLISHDDQTGRPTVVNVVTQYRILKFIAVNVGETQKLRKPLRTIRLGTYDDHVAKASMDTLVIEIIHMMVKRSISSVPIVTLEGVVLNVFEAVDVITLMKGNDYEALQMTVGEALCKRPPDYPGIYTCTEDDGLDTIFETIRRSRVHRLVVVDDNNNFKGVLSLSDILEYILLEGEHDTSIVL